MRELELEAMDLLKHKWEHLYMFGYPKKPFPTNYQNDLNNVIVGLTSKYVEKQKIEFAIKHLEPYLEWNIEFADAIQEHISILEQQMKEL